MEKSQKPSQQPSLKPQQHTIPTLKPTTTTNYNNTNNTNNSNKNKQRRPIWDCGSALYDSFELNSFQRELDSAIISSSRTLSMPRLPSQGGPDHHHVIPQDHHVPPPPTAKPAPAKFSRTFRRLLKSVFKPKNNNKDHYYYVHYYDSCPEIGPEKPPKKVVDGGGIKYFVVYEKVNALATIPEVEEDLSPEIGCLVRKTMSARFKSNCVGI